MNKDTKSTNSDFYAEKTIQDYYENFFSSQIKMGKVYLKMASDYLPTDVFFEYMLNRLMYKMKKEKKSHLSYSFGRSKLKVEFTQGNYLSIEFPTEKPTETPR